MSPPNSSDAAAVSDDDGGAAPSNATSSDSDRTFSIGQFLLMLTLALLSVAYFLMLVV